MKLRTLLASAACAATLGSAGAASAVVIFETGADGPANKNVEWSVDTVVDDEVNGFINGTDVPVTVVSDGEDITTDNHGVVWVVPVDGGFTSLTFTLGAGYDFSAFEVDLKDPTGNNDNWSVTFTTDSGENETFNNFNGGFISAYTEDGSRITSVSFLTNTDITGVGQVRFGGVELNGVAIPEPSTWALMILGFGGAGALLRSRRRALALG